jgi:hypothetical protein
MNSTKITLWIVAAVVVFGCTVLAADDRGQFVSGSKPKVKQGQTYDRSAIVLKGESHAKAVRPTSIARHSSTAGYVTSLKSVRRGQYYPRFPYSMYPQDFWTEQPRIERQIHRLIRHLE